MSAEEDNSSDAAPAAGVTVPSPPPPSLPPPKVVDEQGFKYDRRSILKAASHPDEVGRAKAEGIAEATLDRMVREGTLAGITKDDLTPEAARDLLTKDAQGNDIPILLLSGQGFESGASVSVSTRRGHAFLIVNEGFHKMTPDELAQKVTAQADPQEAKAMRSRYPQIESALATDFKEMEIGGAPRITLEARDTPFDGASGQGRIAVDRRGILAALHSDAGLAELKGAMAHEAAHIVLGNRGKKSLAEIRRVELEADLLGSGPLGTHDPQALIRHFEAILRKNAAEYNSTHPGAKLDAAHLSDGDKAALTQWYGEKYGDDYKHPSPSTRITALQEETELMREYEKTHSVTTHAARKAESDFVVKEVMKGMVEKGLLSAADPAHAGQQTAQAGDGKIREAGGALTQALAQPVDMSRAPDSRPERQAVDRQRG